MRPSFLVIDKPPGVTSHDIVAIVRSVTGLKKVGHTGTLDPFATGVLPLAIGPATRLIQFLDESVKVYDATIVFGTETTTGDPTGEPLRTAELPTASVDEVEAVLRGFIGERMQTPPPYSAVKYKGKPLYYYARRGEEVKVEPRPITIRGLDLIRYEPGQLRILISCSRGTYARVLANEIAQALGSVGHLSQLNRTQSGPFYAEDALGMPELAQLVSAEAGRSWQDVFRSRGPREDRVPWRHRDEVREALTAWVRKPLNALAHLPLADVRPSDAKRIRNGGGLPPAPAGVGAGGRFLVVHGNDLVAVAEKTSRGSQALRVLPAE